MRLWFRPNDSDAPDRPYSPKPKWHKSRNKKPTNRPCVHQQWRFDKFDISTKIQNPKQRNLYINTFHTFRQPRYTFEILLPNNFYFLNLTNVLLFDTPRFTSLSTRQDNSTIPLDMSIDI